MNSGQMDLTLTGTEIFSEAGDDRSSEAGAAIESDPPDSTSVPAWLAAVLVEAILRCDHAGRILEVHGPVELLPAPKDELIGSRIADLGTLPAAFRQAWSMTLDRTIDTQRAQIYAYQLEGPAGLRAFEARVLPQDSGGVAVVIRDVGERNRLRERIEHVAMHDTLTGLPNARALRERLEAWLGRDARGDGARTNLRPVVGPIARPSARPSARTTPHAISHTAPVALLIVDLDRFKQSNDLNGRSIGDSLLRLVAQRLLREASSELRGRPYNADDASNPNVVDERPREDGDILVARIGGDQFAVAWRMAELNDDATDDASDGAGNGVDDAAQDAAGSALKAMDPSAHSAAFATRLITALGSPTRLAGQTLFVRASIGIALHPDDALDAATLFSHAEAALMRAKQAGRNQYRRHGDDDLQARAAGVIPFVPPNNEAALRRALASHEFLLVYQPKFELASSIVADVADAGERGALAPGALIAVEALVRWRTSTGALLTPREFVPLAESSGIIRPLGDWVLATALAEAACFAEQGGARVGVAVNVSLWQLHDRAFVHGVDAALREHGFAPGELTMEIAETAFLEDIRLVADTLAELSALGVRLAIDHFGVGTAGLVALKSLPISEIKIDRSFIAGAAIDAFDATIVAGLIEMAHNLGIMVTAEGVERADQIAALSQMRCDAIQGYFVGEPMRASELVALPRLWRKTRRVRA